MSPVQCRMTYNAAAVRLLLPFLVLLPTTMLIICVRKYAAPCHIYCTFGIFRALVHIMAPFSLFIFLILTLSWLLVCSTHTHFSLFKYIVIGNNRRTFRISISLRRAFTRILNQARFVCISNFCGCVIIPYTFATTVTDDITSARNLDIPHPIAKVGNFLVNWGRGKTVREVHSTQM